jgi:hypothetical protein
MSDTLAIEMTTVGEEEGLFIPLPKEALDRLGVRMAMCCTLSRRRMPIA